MSGESFLGDVRLQLVCNCGISSVDADLLLAIVHGAWLEGAPRESLASRRRSIGELEGRVQRRPRLLRVDELGYAVNVFTNIFRRCLDRCFREIFAAKPFQKANLRLEL